MTDLSDQDFMQQYHQMKQQFEERINRSDYPKKKVVINSCHGGFSLSKEAEQEYSKRTGGCPREARRDNPALIDIIEQMGESANGRYAKLRIVEIPDFVEYTIDDYDGGELIAETYSVL